MTITYNGIDPDIWFVSYNNKSATTGKLYLKNGTIKTVAKSDGKGWWHDTRTDGTEGGSYDIGTRIRHFGESTVSNLTFRMVDNNAGGSGVYKVYGTFKPISAYGHNVQMLDGSTIDLSMKTGAWSNKYTSSDNGNYFVTFAPGTVMVDLTGREAEMASLAKGEVEGNERGYVITWQSANKPTNVTFVPKMANAEKYVLMPTDTGLRIRKPKGLVIIVK